MRWWELLTVNSKAVGLIVMAAIGWAIVVAIIFVIVS